ncbi:LGFP repeat-containing protein [Leucobacter chromiireducens]|uniref:LGFP repeat-containing protein n=1 Tax=Leucobacter chromiireducens TaxID=283877 RepID=UPI003F7D3457
MSAAQVQTFLNQRVPRCTIGDPGKPAGGTYYFPGGGSTKLATKCLKDAVLPSRSMASNPYCSSYVGSKGESAATIIQKVGQACGISQRVLLVMLEKEQSLVQDDFPAQHQFDRAMGYACPDSGPGGSANCDTQYYGFFNQVYYSAWQYKVYRAFPDSYRYKPFQNNTVQWHPNLGCGTSNVYIENRATASLYIYTPYRPNQAALNAGWGTGDACSSYGNRNFYNFYNTWFGSPTALDPVTAKYVETGGSGGILGAPLSGIESYPGGGLGQRFAGGSVFYSPSTGAQVVTDPIRAAYQKSGYWRGVLGYPAGGVESYPGGGLGQRFAGGSVFYSPSTGAQVVTDPIRAAYQKSGYWRGVLGYPAGGVESYPGGGLGQRFAGGSVFYSPSTGAQVVTDPIRAAYQKSGYWRGVLGYPAGGVESYPGGGLGQRFAGGSVFYSPSTGAQVVTDPIRAAYQKSGYWRGVLGYPAGGVESYPGGGLGQRFAGGSVFYSPSTGAQVVTDPIRAAYQKSGYWRGVLGYPAGGVESYPGGGLGQRFAGGSVFYSPSTGAQVVTDPIRAAYQKSGYWRGVLGYPTSGVQKRADGSLVQSFQGGTIEYTAAGKAVVTPKAAMRHLEGDSNDLNVPQKEDAEAPQEKGEEEEASTVSPAPKGEPSDDEESLRSAQPQDDSGVGVTGAE